MPFTLGDILDEDDANMEGFDKFITRKSRTNVFAEWFFLKFCFYCGTYLYAQRIYLTC